MKINPDTKPRVIADRESSTVTAGIPKTKITKEALVRYFKTTRLPTNHIP